MKHFDNIELYLDNELNQVEKIDFEKALSEDKALQRAVAEEKATRATLYFMMTDEFRQRALAEDKAQETTTQAAKIVAMQPQNNWYRWALAAVFIGVSLMTVIYINTNKSIDYAALSAKYTYDYPVPKVQDGASEKQASDAFYSAIKSQNYNLALQLFEQFTPTMQQDATLLFYKGFALLKTQQFGAAEATLGKITNMPESLREATEWYRLMAQMGNYQDIRPALKNIATNENHSYQAKAKALLEEW
jgi:hypothetical protein